MRATGEPAPGGDPTCVAAHHLDNSDAVMRCGGGRDAVECLSDDVRSGVEAKAPFGPPNVVVHRLWNGVDSCTALREARSNGEGVVATDGDQGVQAERAHVRLGSVKSALALQQVGAA